MLYDRVATGAVHRVYLIGLPVLVVVHGMGLLAAGTATGDAVSRVMTRFAHVFGAAY